MCLLKQARQKVYTLYDDIHRKLTLIQSDRKQISGCLGMMEAREGWEEGWTRIGFFQCLPLFPWTHSSSVQTCYFVDTELDVAGLNLTSSQENNWKKRSYLFLSNSLKRKGIYFPNPSKLPVVECLETLPQFLYCLCPWPLQCDFELLPSKDGFCFPTH